MMISNVLVSVTNKDGLELLAPLAGIGWRFISTGGTGVRLGELGIPFTPIEEATGFPEMMDGRVKTLHPLIFGGILGKRDNPDHLGKMAGFNMPCLDLVVVNLYNFVGNPDIEQIDIGGPSLLRAASKNGACTAGVVDPGDYETVVREIMENGRLSEDTREMLAIKVFQTTSQYDRAILQWMLEERSKRVHFLRSTASKH